MAGSDEVEHTADGRYIVVGGRKWRATDPGIPKTLVVELMAARRAVRADPGPARARVHDAKIALGERGRALVGAGVPGRNPRPPRGIHAGLAPSSR